MRNDNSKIKRSTKLISPSRADTLRDQLEVPKLEVGDSAVALGLVCMLVHAGFVDSSRLLRSLTH